MRRFFLASVLLLLAFVPFFSQTAKTADLLQQMIDLPAPAPPGQEDESAPKKDRPADFLSYKNVPPDDAPIEDLTDYWASQTGSPYSLNFNPTASEKTIARLLDYCEENPEELMKFLSSFPPKREVAERVKAIYDKLMNDKESSNYEAYEFSQIRQWLKDNSTFYLDELLRDAQKVKDTNEYISNEDQATLRSLARVDWDSASPLISRLETDSSNPFSQIMAKWVLYQHALDEKDTSDIDKYRRDLQEIVEDKEAHWRKRDLAMDALVAGGTWEGRDEWYLSLLEDETLLKIQDNGNTGLTTLISAEPPDKWIEKMLEAVKSDKLSVRSAAVRNLMNQFSNEKEIARALLPWLTNPNWAKSSNNGERQRYINALGEIDLPESIPGLIAVLTNEEDQRTNAARALTKYKDTRAIPPLRLALTESKDVESRNVFINALIACGGFSDDELMSALEAYAELISTEEGLERVSSQYVYVSDEEVRYRPLPMQISVGLMVSGLNEPGEGLVLRAVERLRILRRTKPAVAKSLAEIMQKWQGRAIYIEMLRQIKTGEANLDLIVSVLSKRKSLREQVPLEISGLHGASGLARAVGACLAEEEINYLSILGQTDRNAQIALFGCARLLRARLPLNEVSGFLKSDDKLLVLAAERYLESQDSAAARNLVLANRPNQASLLGARQAFFTGNQVSYNGETLSLLFESVNGIGFWSPDSPAFNKSEQKLQKEIREDVNLTAVFGVLPEAATGQQIIRVYKDRIVYSFYEDAARYRERVLTSKEYEDFYRFLIENNIDGLSSSNGSCEDCVASEFVMFGKNGGRRIFVGSTYTAPAAFKKLLEKFEAFKKSDLKLRYLLADKIKGLEVLLANDQFPVYSVWKRDDDLRFLVEDKARGEEIEKSIVAQLKSELPADENAQNYQLLEKRRQEIAFAHFAWRKLENGKPGRIVSQPDEAQFLRDETQAGEFPEIATSARAWQVRTKNGEIHAGNFYDGGLYRIVPGQTPVKIKDGKYMSPIVTADGRWAIASKGGEEWNDPVNIVRIDLQTGREFPVAVSPADAFYPLAFVGSQNKVLLYRTKGVYKRYRFAFENRDDDESDEEINTVEAVPRLSVREKQKPNPSPKTPEFYLLDANTGTAQLVKGEFRPLRQLTYRPLQPTANANEFWAAIYNSQTKMTEIGRYNEKTFAFQAVKQIPDISLNSMDIWVDEKEAKIYFVYQGHLLALPLAN
ncbi:MAG: HEAT repeat domain-containing protein [Pyrinomonadaceae bacterium]|nr:HEAT repeat domain-containing protein [Pyrinomonadaceae bacterium]